MRNVTPRHHLVALLGHRQVGQLLEGRQILGGNVAVGGEVHLAGLHRCGPRTGVGDEAGDDAVEVGQSRLPVVLVAVEADVLPPLPLDELERSGADRPVGMAVAAHVLVREHVLGHHGRFVAGQDAQDVRGRAVQTEHRSVLVRGIDRVELPIVVDAARMEFLQHLHEGELDVGAGERLAVVPRHPLAQLEGDRLAVLAHLPRFGETGQRLRFGVVFQQAVVDLRRDLADGLRRADVGRHRRRLRLHDHDERAARFLGLGAERRQREHESGGDGDDAGPQ